MPKPRRREYALAVCRYKLHELDKAVELLHRVLDDARFEQRDEALAVLGHCEVAQEHFDQALVAFDELRAKYPNSKHAELAALSRAQVFDLAKKYPEAEKAAGDCVAQYPGGPTRAEALYFQALSQQAQNKSEPAIASLQSLLGQFPDSPHRVDAFLLLGQALEAQNKLEPAIDAYQRMLAAAPQTRKADALYSLGMAQSKAGRFEAAITSLQSIITDLPASPFARAAKLQLGLAQLAAKKIGDARATLTAVAQDDAGHVPRCEIWAGAMRYGREAMGTGATGPGGPGESSAAAGRRGADGAGPCGLRDGTRSVRSGGGRAGTVCRPLSQRGATARGSVPAGVLSSQALEVRAEPCPLRVGAAATGAGAARPIAELDAENLFLLTKYADAKPAFAELAKGATAPSRRVRFLFREGQCEYFTGNYSAAVAILKPLASEPVVAQTEELQPALLLLGDSLLQQNKFDEAIAPLKQFIDVGKIEKPQAQFKLGAAQMKLKQNDEARQSFTAAAQGPAESAWVRRALFELGQLDLKEKKFDQASDEFRRALAGEPPEDIAGAASYQLGWSQFGGKQFPQAAETWKQMASRYPKDRFAADAEFERGVALREAKQLPEAIEALQGYAARHPDGSHIVKAGQLAAACCKDQGNSAEAARILLPLADQAKGDDAEGVLYDLAWAQRDQKDLPAAEKTYRRLLSEHPDSKLALNTRAELAEILYDQKKYADAVELLEPVVTGQKADPQVLSAAQYRLGWCYQKLNQPDKSAAMFAAYAKSGGGNDQMLASALLQSSLALATDGKYDQAEGPLVEMLKRYPQHEDAPVAMLKLGEIRAELQHFPESQASYAEFLEKYPTSPFAHCAQFGIGWALENQKKYDEAAEGVSKDDQPD